MIVDHRTQWQANDQLSQEVYYYIMKKCIKILLLSLLKGWPNEGYESQFMNQKLR